MAYTLADLVVRRTGVGAAGHPGNVVANQYAAAMQNELGWSEERKTKELQALSRFYHIL
jgi:glycerol-3-phosphate dehydrogenase